MAIRSEKGISELWDIPREDVGARFITAQDNSNSVDMGRKQDIQKSLRNDVARLARNLDTFVEDSREKSIAFTKLEEALMWAGKAIFKEEN